MPSNSSEDLEQLKRATSSSGVDDLLLRRWSPRSFSAQEVEPEKLKTLFDGARWAASSYNEQPWRFFLGIKGDKTYSKIFETLVDMNKNWARSAPVLILSAAKRAFTRTGQANHYALHDTGAATANLALQATALGLHAHSMGGFDLVQARSLLAVPEDFEIGAVTALGYRGDPSSLPDQMQQMETAPRQRNPLGAFVFTAWETPFEF